MQNNVKRPKEICKRVAELDGAKVNGGVCVLESCCVLVFTVTGVEDGVGAGEVDADGVGVGATVVGAVEGTGMGASV